MNHTIKTAVRERYAAIATAGAACCDTPADGGACCEPATSGDACCEAPAGGSACCEPAARVATACCGGDGTVTRLVDYAAEGAAVEPGSDLGLGCGLPTRHARIAPGDTVLDLGSGAGIDVFLAARAVGPEGRVIGVDMTPEMIALATDNARRGGHANVDFCLGDIEDLPVGDASVDVVLSNCVINLVPDKARVFAEIHRVLRPGGRFTVSDIVTFGPIPAAVRTDVAQWTGCIAGAMDRSAYLDVIRAAGFEEVDVVAETTYDALKGPDYGIQSVTVEGIRA